MTWPTTLVAYKRTPEYDSESTPVGLRSEHSTQEGVWAMIRVTHGELLLVTADTQETLSRRNPGLLEPEEVHHVKPEGDVKFYVEFFRDANVHDD